MGCKARKKPASDSEVFDAAIREWLSACQDIPVPVLQRVASAYDEPSAAFRSDELVALCRFIGTLSKTKTTRRLVPDDDWQLPVWLQLRVLELAYRFGVEDGRKHAPRVAVADPVSAP